jgi:hypothetical protein
VHWLIGEDEGQWVQFYPIDETCAHAAGANSWSVGIEFSGIGRPVGPGQYEFPPLTDWQLNAGAHIVRELIDGWGIRDEFLEDADGRVAWFSGFLNHSNVATEPRYTHYDHISRAEHERMARGGQSELGSRRTFVRDTSNGWYYVADGGVLNPVRGKRHGAVMAWLDPAGYTNNYDTAVPLDHSDIIRYSLYADHQPSNWPSSADSDWRR